MLLTYFHTCFHLDSMVGAVKRRNGNITCSKLRQKNKSYTTALKKASVINILVIVVFVATRLS
jgi:hypothetical protein